MFKRLLKAVIATVFLFVAHSAMAGECSLYETLHPNFPLTGSHLSTGKCTACASCHINAVYVGTPKVCATCHITNSAYGALPKSTSHFPIGSTDCTSCHNTTSFTNTWVMDHSTVTAISCGTCHNGTTYSAGYNALGQLKSSATGFAHPLVPTNADCNNAGCHSAPPPGSNLPESLWVLNVAQIHVGITTGCVSCHNNVNATGKASVKASTTLPSGHPTTSDACETCHSTTANFKCALLLDQLNLAFNRTFWNKLNG